MDRLKKGDEKMTKEVEEILMELKQIKKNLEILEINKLLKEIDFIKSNLKK